MGFAAFRTCHLPMPQISDWSGCVFLNTDARTGAEDDAQQL